MRGLEVGNKEDWPAPAAPGRVRRQGLPLTGHCLRLGEIYFGGRALGGPLCSVHPEKFREPHAFRRQVFHF